MLYQRTAQGNTLLLAAAQFMRLFIFIALQMQNFHSHTRTLFHFSLRQLLQLQAKGDVVPNAQMREQCIALEDHSNIALTGSDIVNHAAVHVQLSLGDFLKAGNHTQSSCLAAAGGTKQNQTLTLLYLQIQIIDYDIIAVSLLYMRKYDAVIVL